MPGASWVFSQGLMKCTEWTAARHTIFSQQEGREPGTGQEMEEGRETLGKGGGGPELGRPWSLVGCCGFAGGEELVSQISGI